MIIINVKILMIMMLMTMMGKRDVNGCDEIITVCSVIITVAVGI